MGKRPPQESHLKDYIPSVLWIPHKELLKVPGKEESHELIPD